MLDSVKIPVIKVCQNIGEFYVGVMTGRDLFFMATTDRIRLESLEVPRYAGIQRPLDMSRVKNIRDYLTTPRSTFPNAIVVSLDSDYIRGWNDVGPSVELSDLEVDRVPEVIQIIDGQHRVAALETTDHSFQVIVAIFIDIETWLRAEIFAKINSTQKAVSGSIAFELFGYSQDRSPQRTAHEIATILHAKKGSPFYQKLLPLGKKDESSKGGSLSQASFCKGLMRLYSANPEIDQNRLMRKETLLEEPGLPMRKWFISRNDEKILETVWVFFHWIAETWRHQWFDDTGQSILGKTTGFNALIDVLKKWLLTNPDSVQMKATSPPKELLNIRDLYESSDRRFIRANYPAGNQGVIMLRKALLKDLGLE